MAMRSWWKQPRPDDDDLDREIRAHLAIAEEERVAEGSDRETAHFAALKDFGNVTLDHRGRPAGLDTAVGRGRARSRQRRALRDPRAGQERGILTRRHRRARGRCRPERFCVHVAQEPGAQPPRRRRGVGEPGRRAQPDEHWPPGVAVLPRLRVPPRPRSGVHRAHRVAERDRQPGVRPWRGADLRRAGDRQLLPAPGCACPAGPHAAPVGRNRARPAPGRCPERQPVEAIVRRRSRHRRQSDPARTPTR